MKTEERQLRAAGYTEEAKKLRKRWRRLTADYEIFSIEHKRAFYRYRCVIDRAEVDEAEKIKRAKALTAREYGENGKEISSWNINREERIKNASRKFDNTIEKFYNVIEGSHTIEQDLQFVNPRYGEYGYTENCQRCVVTYEARRRGLDVSAVASLDSSEEIAISFNIDGSINPLGWLACFKDAKPIKFNRKAPEALQAEILDKMLEFGDGARAIIRGTYLGKNYGHVFSAEQIKDGTMFIDSQNNSIDLNLLDFLKVFDSSSVCLIRVDNLELTQLVKMCMKDKK